MAVQSNEVTVKRQANDDCILYIRGQCIGRVVIIVNDAGEPLLWDWGAFLGLYPQLAD
jgi:hypothetical protein